MGDHRIASSGTRLALSVYHSYGPSHAQHIVLFAWLIRHG